MHQGTTRNHFEGKEVVRLEYEAYMPMAKKKMLETCQLVRSQWNVENIVMVHRIGWVGLYIYKHTHMLYTTTMYSMIVHVPADICWFSMQRFQMHM